MKVRRQRATEKENEMRKHRDGRTIRRTASLPDVLSMLVNRHEVLLVRISWHLARFLTFRLDIIARVRPHRDQFQVYGLDLLLLPRLCEKRETAYYRIQAYPIRERAATGFRFPVAHETAAVKLHSAK